MELPYRQRQTLSTLDVDSPRAWLIVASAFLSMFTTFGVLYSFGAFVGPMMEEFRANHGMVSTIFSTAVLLYFLLGAFTGHLADRIGPRPVLLTGALALGAGMALTGLINKLWHGYITYGVGVGIGVACGWVPALAVVGGWFVRYRTAALGVAVSGIGMGTFAIAPVAAALIERWGWRRTALALGVFGAIAMLVCAATMKRPPLTTRGSKAFILSVIFSNTFILLYFSWLTYVAALFITFTFLPVYATEHGASLTAGATLSGLIGFSSVLARAAFGVLATRFGTIRLYRTTFLLYALSFCVWLAAQNYTWLVVFSLALGASYGGIVALSPAAIAELFGLEGLGATIGALYTAGSIGVLMGPPIAGLMIDAFHSYTGAIVLAMVMAGSGFTVLTFLPDERDKTMSRQLAT